MKKKNKTIKESVHSKCTVRCPICETSVNLVNALKDSEIGYFCRDCIPHIYFANRLLLKVFPIKL